MDLQKRGSRLLVACIDHVARQQPDRIWTLRPRNDACLSDGFEKITFARLANAINHAAWWLQKTLGEPQAPFETFAFQAPNDLRIPILAAATVKAGRVMLLPSPALSLRAQEHLITSTKCKAYLKAIDFESRISHDKLGIPKIEVPRLEEWLSPPQAVSFVYNKSWETAKLDPCLIFHTSGTTGLPRPITYTNMMMTSLDVAMLAESPTGEQIHDNFSDSCWYASIPMYHFVGMVTYLQMPVFLGHICAVAPPTPATPETVGRTIELAKVTGGILAPSVVEALIKTEEGFRQIKCLKYLYYAGAPLRKEVGDSLLPFMKIAPAIGTTEAGGYLRQSRNDDDWEWLTFKPEMGAHFKKFSNETNLYEMVFQREPRYERWQQIFQVYPDLDTFCTKDLYEKHPSNSDCWKFAGRTDDLIKLSNGYGVYVAELEEDIEVDPRIEIAKIVGNGLARPFLLIEPREQARSGKTDTVFINEIWPLIEGVNTKIADMAQLRRELTLLSHRDTPFPRTTKETVARNETFQLHKSEIHKRLTEFELDN